MVGGSAPTATTGTTRPSPQAAARAVATRDARTVDPGTANLQSVSERPGYNKVGGGTFDAGQVRLREVDAGG